MIDFHCMLEPFLWNDTSWRSIIEEQTLGTHACVKQGHYHTALNNFSTDCLGSFVGFWWWYRSMNISIVVQIVSQWNVPYNLRVVPFVLCIRSNVVPWKSPTISLEGNIEISQKHRKILTKTYMFNTLGSMVLVHNGAGAAKVVSDFSVRAG